MRTIVLVATLAATALAGDHISKGTVKIDSQEDSYQNPSRAAVRKGLVDTDFGGLKKRPNGKGKRFSAEPAKMTTDSGEADLVAGSNKRGHVQGAKGSKKAEASFKGAKGGDKKRTVARTGNKGEGKGTVNTAHGQGPQSIDYRNVGNKGTPATADLASKRKTAETRWADERGDANGKGMFKSGSLVTDIDTNEDAELNKINVKGAKKHNGDYINTISEDKRRKEDVVTMKGEQLGRNGLDAKCRTGENGQTVCTNGNKNSGSVNTDSNNAASVRNSRNQGLFNVNTEKTGNRRTGDVYNAYITPITRRGGSSRRRPRQRSSGKLYLGNASSFKQKDCYREIKGKNDDDPNDVKVMKDTMKIVYNFKKEGDKSVYTFPDCFKISVDVTLGKGVRVQDLAYEVQARISPVGDLLCADPGVCGKGACYYCDLCDRDKERLALTSNVDRSRACDKAGPQRVTLSTTVCPPPEDYEYAQCAAISNPYTSDFWRKTDQNAIVARFLVWSRPKDIDGIRQNFFYRKEKESGFLDTLKASYTASLLKKGKIERVSLGGRGRGGLPTVEVSEYVLLHYYLTDGIILRPEEFKEKLLMCEAGEADYDIGGSKTGANFLVEAAKKVKSGDNIEDNAFQAKCPAVEEIHDEQVKEMERQWVSQNKPKGKEPTNAVGSAISGIFGGSGGLSSLFGRRRG